MKKEYMKPELTASAEKKFEKVYSGGCSQSPGHSNCSYSDDWTPNGNNGEKNNSRHHNLNPGYDPDDSGSSN